MDITWLANVGRDVSDEYVVTLRESLIRAGSYKENRPVCGAVGCVSFGEEIELG